MNNSVEKSAFPLAGDGEIGYNRAQVDAFIEQARAEYEKDLDSDSEAKVTSTDLRHVSFRVEKGGYAARFVDAALDRLEEVFYEREKRQLLRDPEQAANWYAEMRALASEVTNRASRPKGEKFRRRSLFASGYKRSQVDAFVERAMSAFSGQGMLTVSQVRESLFHSEVRGYDEAQVDAFMDALVQLILAERS